MKKIMIAEQKKARQKKKIMIQVCKLSINIKIHDVKSIISDFYFSFNLIYPN